MRYRKADEILPAELIEQIQEYVDGTTIYIPRKAENRREWGYSTGYKAELRQRNYRIRKEYEMGAKISDLALGYHLSEKSIRRILLKSQSKE